jgi:hypothetical protein
MFSIVLHIIDFGFPLQIVFAGPVHRTEKKTETGPNWTGKDRARGLFMDRSFAVQLLVFHFEKYSRTDEKPV